MLHRCKGIDVLTHRKYDDTAGMLSGTTPDSASATRKTSDEVPITVDFDALSKVNPDIIAWIYSEGTDINYPIVQGDLP